MFETVLYRTVVFKVIVWDTWGAVRANQGGHSWLEGKVHGIRICNLPISGRSVQNVMPSLTGL